MVFRNYTIWILRQNEPGAHTNRLSFLLNIKYVLDTDFKCKMCFNRFSIFFSFERKRSIDRISNYLTDGSIALGLNNNEWWEQIFCFYRKSPNTNESKEPIFGFVVLFEIPSSDITCYIPAAQRRLDDTFFDQRSQIYWNLKICIPLFADWAHSLKIMWFLIWIKTFTRSFLAYTYLTAVDFPISLKQSNINFESRSFFWSVQTNHILLPSILFRLACQLLQLYHVTWFNQLACNLCQMICTVDILSTKYSSLSWFIYSKKQRPCQPKHAHLIDQSSCFISNTYWKIKKP